MNPALLSAISALAGSLIGASASVVTSWFAQRGQSLAAQRANDKKSRETLYSEFILEGSARFLEAIQADAPDTRQFVTLLALVHRIRLYANIETVAAADEFIRNLLRTYYAAPIDLKRVADLDSVDDADPLLKFSTQARKELVGMR